MLIKFSNEKKFRLFSFEIEPTFCHIAIVLFNYGFIFYWAEYAKKYCLDIIWRGFSVAWGKVEYEGQLMPHFFELSIEEISYVKVMLDRHCQKRLENAY